MVQIFYAAYLQHHHFSLWSCTSWFLYLFLLSTAAVTTTTTAVPSQQMNYKQLEDKINKWMTELEEQERLFLTQATQVNAWDRLLIDNGEKVSVYY